MPYLHPMLAIIRRGACLVEDQYFYHTGWQVRIGDEIIPAETRQLMAERTNWGQLLETKTSTGMTSEEAAKQRRKVAW